MQLYSQDKFDIKADDIRPILEPMQHLVAIMTEKTKREEWLQSICEQDKHPEGHMIYLTDKWLSATPHFTCNISSPSLMMSLKLLGPEVIIRIMHKLREEYEEEAQDCVSTKRQVAISWLARCCRGFMSAPEWEKLMPNITWSSYIEFGFEGTLQMLSDEELQRLIDWANGQCSEKGHIGDDYKNLQLYYKRL